MNVEFDSALFWVYGANSTIIEDLDMVKDPRSPETVMWKCIWKRPENCEWVWEGRPREVAVLITFWQATRDFMDHLLYHDMKPHLFVKSIRFLVDRGQIGEREIVYEPIEHGPFDNHPDQKRMLFLLSKLSSCIKNQRFEDEDLVAVRRMLCVMGGITDRWEIGDVKKQGVPIDELITLIDIHKETGVPFGDLLTKFLGPVEYPPPR